MFLSNAKGPHIRTQEDFFHMLTHIDTTRDETYLSHVMKTGVLQIAQLSRRFGGKSVRLRV
jgi:hypothetical protein